MLRTFGLELTSLVNSDPASKVPNGRRSASRRARKPVFGSLKKCTGLIRRSSESSNMPVSGSEKRAPSMLDCAFSEKAKHVPIKKRRFLLRSSSPSPPPPVIASQCTEETVSLSKSLDNSNKLAAVDSASTDISLGKIIDNKISFHGNKSEMDNKSFGKGEDFSGISILAAAACSSNLVRESGHPEDGSGVEDSSAQARAHEVFTVTEAHLPTRGTVKEDHVNSSEVSTCATSSCVSTEPVGELTSISPTVNSSRYITAGKGAKEVSLNEGSVILSGDVSCSKDDDRVDSVNMCSKDDRFHWDLNVAMDAWEHPFESPMEKNDIPVNFSQDAGESSQDDKAEVSRHDLQFKLATTCATQTSVVPGESITLVDQRFENGGHDTDMHRDVTQPSYLDEKPLLSDCKKNLDSVKRMGEDSKLMSYNRFTKSVDSSVNTTSNPATYPSALCVLDQDDNISGRSLKFYGDVHKESSILQGLNLSTGASYCTLEILRSACASNDMQPSPCVSPCSELEMEVKPKLAFLENMKTYQELLRFNGNSLSEKGEMKIEPLGPPCVTSDANNLSHSSCSVVPNSFIKHEFLVASDAEAHNVDVVNGEKLVCGAETTVNLSDFSMQSKEACESVVRDTCRTNLDSSFYQNSVENGCSRPLSVVGTREDYDSQYEDGEVRELNEHPWEVEHVDFESDLETSTSNPAGYLVSDCGQVEVRENHGPGEPFDVLYSACNTDNKVAREATKSVEDYGAHEEDNKIKLNPKSEEKTKASMSKELLVCRSGSSDMDTGVSDDDGAKGRLDCNTDKLVDSKGVETRIESKPFRRGLQLRIEGPVANGTSSRKDWLNKVENRYEESSSMRSFERPQYSFHNQSSRRQSDSWDGFPDNRRGFKRHYSPIMHRNSKQDDDTIMQRDDIEYNGVQDDVSYSHQRHPKSRSAGNEDDSFYPRKLNRAFSPGRRGAFGRGRSIRYCSLGDNRGGRGGRYNGPPPDDNFQSSLKYRRPLSLRERSFSPLRGHGNSNVHQSRGKSPSQSRSRSPIMWNSLRGRPGAGRGGSTFLRHRSRSPNFGSDMRMQRLRSGHQQQSDFVPDDTVSFGSVPRNCGSPPHGRWNSSGKEGGHFREFGYTQKTSNLERSPGRTRFRGDRAGVFDPPRNLKPDGYYRVSEDADCRGGPRYEENFEGRRKHFGPLRPARRSYEDGMAGRLHQDVNDRFSMPKGLRDNRDSLGLQGRGKGIDNRVSDFPRRLRGGQQSFTCKRDGKFTDMDSSHNLKSEEQYRSSNTVRFTDMDGVNRGRRYENFEERRKQYDPPNLMKRTDTEGSEKRLNEKFQDNPDICGRGMRSFDGLSTRLRVEKDSTGCGQEMKLEENP